MSNLKLSYDEALEALNEERRIASGEVRKAALNRRVWVASHHFPGCLDEYRSICATKSEAIGSALEYIEGFGIEDGYTQAQRRAIASLKRIGAAHFAGMNHSVSSWSLSDLLW